MEYALYVIANPENLLYKGITSNLEKRLRYHNSDLGNWTKGKGPWKLVYSETLLTKTEALKRERLFKSGKGREFLKNIIGL